jgi:ribonuclease HII
MGLRLTWGWKGEQLPPPTFCLSLCHRIGFGADMSERNCPDYQFETLALNAGALRVVGVDEVGRGPLAGPVTASAVWLNPDAIPDGLNDSKVLTADRRIALCTALLEMADVSIGHASVEEIDALNILRASHLAMVRAIQGLRTRPDFALIDGNMIPIGMPCRAQAIIKGDARSLSIAAASIVAKVARDAIMVDLAQQHPGYGWETNAGYPTAAHREALLSLGVTPHHRRSFRPVHKMLYQA